MVPTGSAEPLPLGRHAPLRGRASELTALARLVEAVLAGQSRVLVIRGEPGAGKTALLDYLAGQASGCRVVRALGVQSEMELAFAGLHQLCVPMLTRLDGLPEPQREALRTAFGLSAGPAPDRFLVGLAVLSLLVRGGRGTAAAVPGGRPPVAGQRLGSGAGVRGAAAGGRPGRPGPGGP